MHTLRRITRNTPPLPRPLEAWRAELLTAALLAGGLLGLVNGWG